jgi:hypothetical protein
VLEGGMATVREEGRERGRERGEEKGIGNRKSKL